MRKRVGVTASEMRQLREQGLSNHDIARSLDISYGTVLRYIGKQGGRKMENLEAFKDSPKCVVVPNDVPQTPPYQPTIWREEYQLSDDLTIELDHAERMLTLHSAYEDHISIGFGELPDLLQFLAWAAREKIQEEE